MTWENRVVSSNDSFILGLPTCATSYRFFTGNRIEKFTHRDFGFVFELFFIQWIMQSVPDAEMISSPLSLRVWVVRSFVTWRNSSIVYRNELISYAMHFWSQTVAFYFLQFLHLWISVMIVIFYNTECCVKGLLQTLSELHGKSHW